MFKKIKRLYIMMGLFLSVVAKGDDISDRIVECEIVSVCFDPNTSNLTICASITTPVNHVTSEELLRIVQEESSIKIWTTRSIAGSIWMDFGEAIDTCYYVINGKVQAELVICIDKLDRWDDLFFRLHLLLNSSGLLGSESVNIGRVRVKTYTNGSSDYEVSWVGRNEDVWTYEDFLIDHVVHTDEWLRNEHLRFENGYTVFTVRFEYDLEAINDATIKQIAPIINVYSQW